MNIATASFGQTWNWAMEWIGRANKYNDYGAKRAIQNAMSTLKERGSFDGMWNPDQKLKYDALNEAIGMLQNKRELL